MRMMGYNFEDSETSFRTDHDEGDGQMRHFCVLMIALLVLPESMARAQEDPGARVGKGKPAWEWTDEERITARLSPDYVWDQQPTGDPRF